VSTMIDCTTEAGLDEGIEAARQALGRQQCVVLPTDTVYGIGADAFSPQAVAVLLAAKGRGRSMPPPVLIGAPQVMDGLAVDIPEAARELAEAFWPGALTLILTAQPSLAWDLGETRGTVALRVPDDQVARELLQEVGPMAVSSANRTGLPAATSARAAEEMLGGSVAVYLDDGDRAVSAPSTIVDCTVSPFRVVRQGALPFAELLTVVPDLRGPDGNPDGGAGPAGPAVPSGR
jgi:L-threonylcarbamoyladenylate synthase